MCKISIFFYLMVWGKLRLSTLAVLRILKCCHHAKATPEQLCLQSQAREHFPFHNSFPRCMIKPHIHRKQNNKALKYACGRFWQEQVYRLACLLKELFRCFLYLFLNYQFTIESKCVKMSLVWSVYLEITLSVFRYWVFTSWNFKWPFKTFSISHFCGWDIC